MTDQEEATETNIVITTRNNRNANATSKKGRSLT